MAEKSKEQEQAPKQPDTPVPESEVISMGEKPLSDDPDKATAQILEGQTGQGEGDGTSEKTKFSVGGQEFEIDPGLASALQAQQDDFQAQNAELRGLMPKRPEPKIEPEPKPMEGPNYGEMLFDDPQRFVKEFGDDIRKQTIEEMKGEYSADQGMQRFWDNFYRANEDLREFDWVVQASLNRHNSELIDLPVSQAAVKLAEVSRADILGLAGKFGSGEKGKSSRTTVESGRSTSKAAPETGSGMQADAGKVTSISSVLRNRRKGRRQKAS